jgi:hypothetical protein
LCFVWKSNTIVLHLLSLSHISSYSVYSVLFSSGDKHTNILNTQQEKSDFWGIMYLWRKYVQFLFRSYWPSFVVKAIIRKLISHNFFRKGGWSLVSFFRNKFVINQYLLKVFYSSIIFYLHCNLPTTASRRTVQNWLL